MKLPNRNRNWLKEIQTAYPKAQRDVERDQADIEKTYVYAVKYVAKNRGIKDKALISSMIRQAVDSVKLDLKNDPESVRFHKFHFVSVYIYSHYYADIIDEFECDRIMDYVNSELDLFADE